MTGPAVEVRDLAYRYPDGTEALAGVSFTVAPGEAVGVIGANGAGKSTLLHLLNGLLPASGGEVRIGGEPLTPKSLPAIRRAVGLVFQDADDQLFTPSVEDDVAFGPRHLGLPPAEVAARVRDALSRVGLWEQRAKAPFRLSGGEKKRVAIASVLSMVPAVLVVDEPTAGLDPHARRQLLRLLAEFDHTRIFTSHDLDMVAELCPRTIVLDRGRVRADAPTATVFRDDALLRECRLERPLAMQACPVCSRGTPGGG